MRAVTSANDSLKPMPTSATRIQGDQPGWQFPAEIAQLLTSFRDGVAARCDLTGLYVYGSLTTGDFSPARSDIDLVAVIERPLDGAALQRLTRLHTELASSGGPARRLHCLYVPAAYLGDSLRLHQYWFGNRFTRWQLKVITQAELAASAHALCGDWPVPGLAPVPVPELQAAVRAEVGDYWRRMAGRRMPWLKDNWVDFGLITLPRAAAVLSAGDLITKTEAIGRLGAFDVPAELAEQIRRRRAGEQVRLTLRQRMLRAWQVRRIMTDGVTRLCGRAPLMPG